jgi:mono/diheme cytochrome c family protein
VDDFRKITYGVLIGFILMIVVWISFLTFTGCGFKPNCAGAVPTAERTSIPTLVPATLPGPARQLGAATLPAAAPSAGTAVAGGQETAEPAEEVARPSNAGGPGPAVSLAGDAASGQQIFATNCQICHNTAGKGGNPNPGSEDGTVPPLNPIDPTLVSSDPKTFATNLDLFVEHGSTPAGPNPTFSMIAWGDKKLLNPQQIADVIAYVMSLNPVTAVAQPPAAAPTGAKPVATASAASTATLGAAAGGIARPSNPGGPGEAVGLTGDANSGRQLFVTNCQTCHNTEGKGGNPNPGSADGTIPALNPVDTTLVSSDYKTFATNLDLFIEHGSTPSGPNPTFSMLAWGDKKLMTPQQIADVIAYVISLNNK